jgi:putative addiction module component (TIGR02574 family)
MSTQQLTKEALALPLSERIDLAQVLWESIHSGAGTALDNDDALQLAIRRKAEVDSGAVQGVSHREAMEAARRAIGCE